MKQAIPGADDIKVLCAEEEATYLSWIAGIRLAKYGNQLKDNFYKAKKTQFKLEDLNAGSGAPKAEVGVPSLFSFCYARLFFV